MSAPKIVVSCSREEPLDGYESSAERRENLAQRIASILYQETMGCHWQSEGVQPIGGLAFRSPTVLSDGGCSCVPVRPYSVMKRALAILGQKQEAERGRSFDRLEKTIAEEKAKREAAG